MNSVSSWRCAKAGTITLLELLDCIEDPRGLQGRKYPLSEVLMLAVIGYALGKKDMANMEHYLKRREEELKKILNLSSGVPSHDTFSRIMRTVDQDDMALNVLDWISLWLPSPENEQIILAGKASRASAEKKKGEPPPYIINVVQAASDFFMYHHEVGPKENEITALPRTIKVLDVKNKTITIDPIGTQKKIMELIRSKGGEFVLAVKGNWENTEQEIRDWIETSIESHDENLQIYNPPSEKNSGRYETRQYFYIPTNQ